MTIKPDSASLFFRTLGMHDRSGDQVKIDRYQSKKQPTSTNPKIHRELHSPSMPANEKPMYGPPIECTKCGTVFTLYHKYVQRRKIAVCVTCIGDQHYCSGGHLVEKSQLIPKPETKSRVGSTCRPCAAANRAASRAIEKGLPPKARAGPPKIKAAPPKASKAPEPAPVPPHQAIGSQCNGCGSACQNCMIHKCIVCGDSNPSSLMARGNRTCQKCNDHQRQERLAARRATTIAQPAPVIESIMSRVKTQQDLQNMGKTEFDQFFAEAIKIKANELASAVIPPIQDEILGAAITANKNNPVGSEEYRRNAEIICDRLNQHYMEFRTRAREMFFRIMTEQWSQP